MRVRLLKCIFLDYTGYTAIHTLIYATWEEVFSSQFTSWLLGQTGDVLEIRGYHRTETICYVKMGDGCMIDDE